MITTLNQVIDKIREFSEENKFVVDFGTGQPSDISTTTPVNYPLIWATFGTSSILVQNRTAIPSIQLTILSLDRVNNENPPTDENGSASTNELEVLSDRMQVLQDLIVWLTKELKPLGALVEPSFTLDPTYDDVDKTAGWVTSFNIKLPYNNCFDTLPK